MAATHTSEAFTWPSSTTVLTLSLVISCGVSSTDGTFRLPFVSSELAVASASAAALSPLASAAASWAVASASCLIGL